MLLDVITFVGFIIFPSLDHRFSRSNAPRSVVIVGDVLVALGFLITFIRSKRILLPPLDQLPKSRGDLVQ